LATAKKARTAAKTKTHRRKPAAKKGAETTSSPKIALNARKKGSLKQTSILFLSGITAVILLALVTYHPDDPGLFHYDSNAIIQNKAGAAGAYLADILIGFFGYLAYLIPLSLMISAFILFRSTREKNSGINLGITILGVFLALIAGCGLATLLWPESNLSHTSGGLLGHGIARMFVRMFGDIGATMILFSGFVAGITLFADIRWLKLIDKIGESILNIFELFNNANASMGGIAKESLETGSIPLTSSSKLIKQNDESPANNQGSLFGAVKSGLSDLFMWKTGNKNNGLATGSHEPRIDPLDDFVDSDNKRREPQLGIPDYLAENKESTKLDTQQISMPQPQANSVAPLTQKKVTKKAVSSQSKAAPTVSLDKALTLPPVSLLNPPPTNQGRFSKEQLEVHAHNIVETLEHFGVRGVQIESYCPGPIITRFELQLPPGTKVSKITGLAQDMARSMCVSSIRIVEVIPGKTTIGVEVPNDHRDLVSISQILDSDEFRDSTSPLTMVLGKTIEGHPAVADLSRMPHLLIAGTTGSGKSVGVNAMLISLLYKATPEEVKLILIDPKMLELSIYEGIPHLLTPVVTDMKDASNGLRWAVGEMERRYALMSHMKVRNIAGYNEKVKEAIDRGEPITDPSFDPTQHIDVRPSILEPLPFIVIVIDEFADMMMVVGKKVEELIARLAQKARAAGIHLILATQRPSVDVITGLIKANIPTRIAFQVSTKIDSRTILDQGGAESLLGHGDMLYLPPGSGLPQRVHGAFVADSEVEEVVNYLKLQGEPEYLTEVLEETGSSDAIPGLEPLADSETDALYDQAVAIVTESRRASISYVQRRLKVGYNRAASMIEDMEKAGVVSAVQSNGMREVIAPEPVAN